MSRLIALKSIAKKCNGKFLFLYLSNDMKFNVCLEWKDPPAVKDITSFVAPLNKRFLQSDT